jgi:hypothetical protein
MQLNRNVKEAGASEHRIQEREEILLQLSPLDQLRKRTSSERRSICSLGKLPPSRRQSSDVEKRKDHSTRTARVKDFATFYSINWAVVRGFVD